MKTKVFALLFACLGACVAPCVGESPSKGMPANLFPDAAPSFPAPSVTEVPIAMPPQNLDPLDAAQLQTDVEAIFINGIEAARLMLHGGKINRRVDSTDGVNINVKAPGAALVKSGGTRWKVLPKTTNFAAFAPGGLAINTRYWLYCYDNAGTLTLEHSTTGPDASFAYKSGDLSRMWLSTFITDGAAAIIPFAHTGTEYTYSDRTNAGGAGGNQVLAAGAAVILTTVSLVGAVPSGAERAQLRLLTVGIDGVFVSSTGAAGLAALATTTPAASTFWEVDVSLSAGLSFDYVTTAGTTQLFAWVGGFSF